ncbi:MAG: hypothetical protein K9N55_06435 [Phycisphaerae bacterium]|nr:hypothetical protein [Phycisphaerae bacterium]
MKRIKGTVFSVVMVVLLSLASVTLAQRGMGDAVGVVRQGLSPEIVALQGEVVRIITGPCEKSTGPSELGTHFIVKIEQGQERNIHLGPAHLVQNVTDLLSGGGTVSVSAFRTEKMLEGHYNAVTVRLGNQMIRLRGQNLRPVWAGNTLSVSKASVMAQGNVRQRRNGHLQRGRGRACQNLQRGLPGGRLGSSGRRCRGRGWCGQVGQPRCRMQRSLW